MRNLPKMYFVLLFLSLTFKTVGQECETQLIITNQFSGISLGPSCNFFQDLAGQFQPELKQINKAEQALNDQLCKRMIEHPQIDSKYAIKNPIKHFRKWKRQYFGYMNELGEQIIEINLLNFGARKAENRFKGWTKDFVIGFGDFYEKNTRRYTYNLETGKLEI